MDVELGVGLCAEGAGGEEEGVAGEKGGDDESCLGKDYGEEQCVGPRAVLGDEVGEVRVNVEDEVEELAYEAGHACVREVGVRGCLWLR